jgi:hypothetical protein
MERRSEERIGNGGNGGNGIKGKKGKIVFIWE